MAYNKEYIVFVLDVRQFTPEDFKQKSIKCCADLMKQKICCAKKDYVSFVLVGTEQTVNDINTNICPKGYLNVTQCEEELQIPSWHVLMNFYQFVNQTASNKGEWLDALVVALGMIKSGLEQVKLQRLRIVLFYDFNDGPNSYDAFDDITEQLLTHNVELIVVSPNIAFIDNEANNNLPQAIFNSGKKSSQQLQNEKYALRLVSDCNAKMYNLSEALFGILKAKNKRPWTWNNDLRIGSKISIAITGIIAAKDECTIKLKKVWNEADEVLSREWGYFIEGNQICPDEDSLMDGYMLGGTPVAYDDSAHDDKIKLPPGLTFMGFIPRKSVYDEYFCGNSVYLILHQRGKAASARKLDALVRVLLEADRAILCWKVYSVKFNKSRIVVLLPNEMQEDCPASFSMVEVAHHHQYHFFDFPKLTTKRTQCSDEQLNAIDNLIDTMDLTLKSQDSQTPRETSQKDLLPFDKLPHIFERNFMDIMERRILCKASEDDEQFQEILKDKNFAEVYWKIPEQIEENAKEAAKRVKNVFPLQISTEWQKKLTRANAKNATQTQTNQEESTENGIELGFDHVRFSSPAEDFEQLLKAYVFPIKDSTQRDVKFNHYASQLRSVIKALILKSKSVARSDLEKITAALIAYRKRCFVFNAFDDYNTWITSIKTEVMNRRMAQFWQDVIVKHELGLCFIGEPSLDEQIKEKEFYNLEFGDCSYNLTPEEMEMNDTDVDDLLASIP